MKIIFGILGLSIIVLLSGCATSDSIKNDSAVIWKGTKKVSKETWYGAQKVSKETWHGTKEVSKKVWDESKKTVHNATEE